MCFVCFICGGGCAVVLYVLSVRVYWCVVVCVCRVCVLPFLPLSPALSSAGPRPYRPGPSPNENEKRNKKPQQQDFSKQYYIVVFLLSIGCLLIVAGRRANEGGRRRVQPHTTKTRNVYDTQNKAVAAVVTLKRGRILVACACGLPSIGVFRGVKIAACASCPPSTHRL